MRTASVVHQRAATLTVSLLLTAGGSSWAHHGYRSVFDDSQKHTLIGTLTKVDWRNPHIELSLEVKDDGGQVQAWIIEGAPPIFFLRRSVSKTAFQNAVGHTVTVEAYHARDGTPRASWLKITFADGTSVTNDPSV